MILNFEDNMSVKYLEKSCTHFLMAGCHSNREPPCQCRRHKRAMQVQSLGREDPLEEEMATHSSILAWENP